MSGSEPGKKHLPPYVSYRTFRNFLERLQAHVPSRIDRSFWGEFLSGSNGVQLVAALRFLKLIDLNGKPVERLKVLVTARGEKRAEVLRQVTNDSYGFISRNGLDIESATYSQLQEAFHESFQLTDDVSRKCVKFYISIANDAGLAVSPFITKHTRSVKTGQRTKTTGSGNGTRTNRGQAVPQEVDNNKANGSWNALLLAKFPNFDPAWNDDLKMKWFAAFDELLKRNG